MANAKRKIEIYRLTISGNINGKGYGSFVKSLREPISALKDLTYRQGSKTHALYSAQVLNGRLRMKFMSFTTGYRPDVIDIDQYRILPNPLTKSQTGVEWTHVLGGKIGRRYVLLIERARGGIYPTALEGYLQWLVDGHFQPEEQDEDEEGSVVVNVDPEADEAFINRMSSLDRITKATVRTVRPNPGWADLEGELSEFSSDSDAGKLDVTMTAKRRGSLSKTKGIIKAIKDLFSRKELTFASVEGVSGDQKDSFTTNRLGRFRFLTLEIDSTGQVLDEDAWKKLSKMINEVD